MNSARAREEDLISFTCQILILLSTGVGVAILNKIIFFKQRLRADLIFGCGLHTSVPQFIIPFTL